MMRTGIYREDGLVAKVEIIEDNSDREWIRLKLKVLRVLANSPLGPTKPGEEFPATHKRGAGCFSGMWHLSEDAADA